MKKIFLLIPALMAVSLLSGCANSGNTSSSGSTPTSGGATSTSVPGGSSSSSSTSSIPGEVKFITQPTSQEVEYPNAVSFSVEVNNPDLVDEYRWEVKSAKAKDEEGEGPLSVTNDDSVIDEEAYRFIHSKDEDLFSSNGEHWVELDGEWTHTNVLTLPHTPQLPKIHEFRCVATLLDGSEIISDVGSYTLTNKDEFKAFASLCEYPILPGKTLDLRDTLYGTGKISLDETGSKYIFDNVHFNNSRICIDDWIYNSAFEIDTHCNEISDYEFNFIGANVIDNVYWEEDNHQGGLGMFLGFIGDSDEPTVTFKGDGNLTIHGGTFGILSYAKLIVDIDINFVGSPKRLTKGIVTSGLTLKANRSLNATIGNEIIFTQSSYLGGNDVFLEPGSVVRANIDVGQVSKGSTNGYGISAAGYVVANEALIDINIVVDMTAMISTNHSVAPLYGINAFNGAIKLTDCDVKVNYHTINPDTSTPEKCAAGLSGLSAQIIQIKGGRTYVDMCSPYVHSVEGIHCLKCEITNNAYINIRVGSDDTSSGILAELKADVYDSGKLLVEDSSIDIVCLPQYETEFHKTAPNAALRVGQLVMKLGANDYIDLYCENGAAIIIMYEIRDDKIEHATRPYTPTHIDLSSVTYDIGDNEWNIDYYSRFDITTKKTQYVCYESLYTNGLTGFVNSICFHKY